jgi:hypothetical protein
MELVGDEKRIQALFRELRLEDECITPRFATIWNRARSESIRPRRAFNFSFTAATLLLVFALGSLAWWSIRWPRTQQPNAVVAGPSIPSVASTQEALNPEPSHVSTVEPRYRSSFKSRSARFAVRRNAEMLAARRAAIREAAAISSWQSPTATLLSSQNDELLKSLPQLGDSVNALKSFLPKTSN